MRTVCKRHKNSDPGSLGCWGCEVERLRKLVLTLQDALDKLQAIPKEMSLPEEEKQLNESAARMRYDLDVNDAERSAREYNDDPNLP